MLPCLAVILHAVSSSDQPEGADDGRSTDVTIILYVEADLPGKLSLFCILTTDNTRRFEHAPPTVCKVSQDQKVALPGLLYHTMLSICDPRVKLGIWPTYRSWPRQIRPHSQEFRHILGSL